MQPNAEMMATAANVVAVMVLLGKLLTLYKLGTMMNPPPRPSNPDNNPAVLPVKMSRFVQAADQNSREVAGLIVQTGGGFSLLSVRGCLLNVHIRYAIQSKMTTKVVTKTM